MALGASRGSVQQLVLCQGLVLVCVGILFGAAGAAAFSRLIAQFLFQTAPTDPIPYAMVAGVLLLAGLAAAAGPARRATTTDPLTALRTD
jgi:ABC-type antimicrobial peptide transport system permease subunit